MTGVKEVTGERLPFAHAPIVEHLQLVRDDERNNVVVQTFLEQYQMPDKCRFN